MADLLITRRGGKSADRTAAPSINFISATTTSLTFTFKNNEDTSVDVYYGLTTPPTIKITLAANATSSNITFSPLNNTDTFNIYSYSVDANPISKKIKSEIVSMAASTLVPVPTITQVSKTAFTITFTVRNNSRLAGNVVFGITNPPTTTIALNSNTTSSNQTISNLNPVTTYTVFAQTQVPGFSDSAIVSSNVTTETDAIYTAATGGTTLEYNSSGKRYRSHTFNSNGTFTVTTVGNDDRNQLDYLIIAGGGGGGAGTAGGGGAGGYRTTLGTSGGNSSPESKVTSTAQSYTITVGAGGPRIFYSNANIAGNNGNNSSAFSITATNGGGGGNRDNLSLGKNGGSGGGGPGADSGSRSGGTGIAGQGSNGGTGRGGGVGSAGGGGGGAGALGSASPSTGLGGNGGNGLASNLRTGSNETRGGGGGGGSHSGRSFGGTGGGGRGSENGPTYNAEDGIANTGGGGGGAGGAGGGQFGGAGGSGIVIIRYEIAPN